MQQVDAWRARPIEGEHAHLLDRKRMENGAFLDDDYFEQLLEEIREIRLSVSLSPFRTCYSRRARRASPPKHISVQQNKQKRL